MTFTDAIRISIMERFKDGKSFCVNDFHDIVDEFGSTMNTATNVLRDLVYQNKLRSVGERKRSSGGSPHKVYCVVANADFTPKLKVNHQVNINKQKLKANECSKRLEAAMRSWK